LDAPTLSVGDKAHLTPTDSVKIERPA